MPVASRRSSTWASLALATAKCAIGLVAEEFDTMPASSAAWDQVSLAGDTPK